MAINPRLQAEINDLIRKLQQLEPHMKKGAQEDMASAAEELVAAIKRRAPIGERPHSRYSTAKVTKKIRAPKGSGRVVATYQPGNLQRSFRVLKFRRSQAVFVGPKVGNKRADGYYAHWVEFGTKNQKGQKFVSAAVSAVGNNVLNYITELLGKRVTAYATKVGKETSGSFFTDYAKAKGRQ